MLAEQDSFLANEEYARLMAWRWPNGRPECPKCGHDQFYIISARKQFNCKACRHHFSITSGTIFHSIKISARKLIEVIDAMADDPDIAAAEIMRQTGMSYKGAWYLVSRIRQQGWFQP